VEIPQQGDVRDVEKPEATRALPLLGRTDNSGATEKAKKMRQLNLLNGD